MRRRDLNVLLGALGASLTGLARLGRAASSPERDLFTKFSKSPGFSSNFVELKRIALLKEPIENRGRLYFARPDLFARHIDSPFRSAMLLKGGKLILWDGTHTRSIDLEKNSAVAALATSFLSLLRGERGELESSYQTKFAGDSLDAWKLDLVPKHAELQSMVKRLSFQGHQLRVTRLEVVEATSDSSTTNFFDTNPKRRFSREEQARFFTVPGS